MKGLNKKGGPQKMRKEYLLDAANEESRDKKSADVFFGENRLRPTAKLPPQSGGRAAKGLNKKGFTLLEILIVVLIIGFLATLAVINFNSIRKSAQLTFTADSIINVFNSTKDGARLSKGPTNENKSVCWGVVIDTTKNRAEQIRQFTVPYIRNKKSCDISNEPQEFKTTGLFQEEPIKLYSITTDKNQTFDKIIILFKPPRADVEIFDKFGTGSTKQKAIKLITFSIGFETNNSDPTKQIDLQFNAFSGEVKKLK